MRLTGRHVSILTSNEQGGRGHTGVHQTWRQRYTHPLKAPSAGALDSWLERPSLASQLHLGLEDCCTAGLEKTAALIAKARARHPVIPEPSESVMIAQDVYRMYDLALTQYVGGGTAADFVDGIAGPMGQLRDRYGACDPHVIGFASMQFQYTGQRLLQGVDTPELEVLALYVQAINDYLYMPIQRAHTAAMAHRYNAPELTAIFRLMPASRKIAHTILDKVLSAFPYYYSHSGPLTSSLVKAASVRDIEMFQAYLWVCVLEGSSAAVRHELFPLCVTLYPMLHVSWELVNYMLTLLGHELGRWLEPAQLKQFKPHLATLKSLIASIACPNQLCFA